MKPRVSFPLSAILAAVLAFVSPTAMAGLYGFVAGGVGVHEFADVGNGSAYKFGVGLASNGPASRFAVEASWVDLGEGYISTAPTGHLGMSGVNVSVSSELPIQPMVLGGRVGFYNFTTTDSGIGSSISSTGLSWGVTIGYQVNKQTTVFMDTDGYGNVETAGGTETPTSILFGVKVEL
jgi:hypothetical protein